MASARSVIRMHGILGTKSSPPCIAPSASTTKSDPLSSVIKKRVMRSSVIGSPPVGASCWKNGMTLPRLPMTLP